MNLAEIFLFIASAALIAFMIVNRKKIFSSEENTLPVETLKLKEEEERKRAHILNKIESFLKSSQFVEPIAKWREEKIYKYILNDGCLYEFDEIMAEQNQRIGIDENFLCFKQMMYKRVNNPQEFFENFKLTKINSQDLNLSM